MDLEAARRHIQTALERMRACYLKPVFDEWAILSVPAKTGGVVAYNGPRPDVFRQNVPQDAEPLRAITAVKKFAEGDIEFVPSEVSRVALHELRLSHGRARLSGGERLRSLLQPEHAEPRSDRSARDHDTLVTLANQCGDFSREPLKLLFIQPAPSRTRENAGAEFQDDASG